MAGLASCSTDEEGQETGFLCAAPLPQASSADGPSRGWEPDLRVSGSREHQAHLILPCLAGGR